MKATIFLIASETIETNLSAGYIIGAIIALLILGYLGYALIKPENF